MTAERFELPRHECLELLAGHNIGRLAIIDHDCPVAFPLNYRLDTSREPLRIVMRTAPETLMGRYTGPASLEVDRIDLDAGWAWSVIVRGRVSQVLGVHDLPDPGPLLDGRYRWVVLEPTAISG